MLKEQNLYVTLFRIGLLYVSGEILFSTKNYNLYYIPSTYGCIVLDFRWIVKIPGKIWVTGIYLKGHYEYYNM